MTRLATDPRPPAAPVVLVLRTLLPPQRWLLWLALGIAVLATGTALALRLLAGIDGSIWQYAGTPPRWILFVIGTVLTPAVLPTYLAHGITRRTFATAVAAGGAVLAVAAAGFVAAGLLLERSLFALTGAAAAPTLDRPHVFDSATQVHLVLVEYGLTYLAYLVSGWLVGSVYYRFGGRRGSMLLVPALLPLGTVEILLGGMRGWAGDLPVGAGVAVPLAAALSLAATAAGLAAAWWTVRAVPVRPVGPGRMP